MKKLGFEIVAPLLIFLFAVFSGFIIYRAAWFGVDKHFSLLADSFLKGDLFLSPMNLPDGDYVDFNGRQYLFFGPLPSVLLMPAIAIWGKNFAQMTLSVASLVVVYFSIFWLLEKLRFKLSDRFWLSNFFVFGTVLYFVGLINVSAYVVQALGVALVVLSLFEYFSLKRWFVIGLLIAAAGATRISLFAMAVFYALEIWRLRRQIDLKKSLVFLLIPIVFSLVVLGIYNLRRFGSVFDTGYSRNVSVLNKGYPNLLEGTVSIKHIPANLYLLLAAPPDPVKKDKLQFVMEFPYLRADGQGMAIWFTSPLFIYLLFARRQPYTISAIFGIIALAIPSLLYFGLGISQFGYRYSLDFIPLLFLILVSAFQKGVPTFAKVLIAVGIFFNLFYMSSLWNSYPLLNFWEYLD